MLSLSKHEAIQMYDFIRRAVSDGHTHSETQS